MSHNKTPHGVHGIVRRALGVGILTFIVAIVGSNLAVPLAYAEGASADSNFTGDAEALARVDLMIERIGGKALWANAKTLYIEERSYHPNFEAPIQSSFWRDLEAPGEWTHLAGGEFDVKYAWDATSGWFMRDGEVRDYDTDELAERNYYWHREIYTLYHQLAKGEKAFRFETIGINGFVVFNEADEKISEFHLTKAGDLFYWRQYGGDDPVAYVYGPKKEFGEVRFADWGGNADGTWRFYYLKVEPSSKPISEHISLAKPTG